MSKMPCVSIQRCIKVHATKGPTRPGTGHAYHGNKKYIQKILLLHLSNMIHSYLDRRKAFLGKGR